MCGYELELSVLAAAQLRELRAFERLQVVQTLRRELVHEPAKPTRRRKMLEGAKPPFEAVPPIRRLRVGEIRVFYDVAEDNKKVFGRAIRRKPPHQTTEEIP